MDQLYLRKPNINIDESKKQQSKYRTSEQNGWP